MTTTLTNHNCLEGIACPSCKSEGPFMMAVTAVAEVHDNGTEDTKEHDWNDESHISCSCGKHGTVGEFSLSATAITLQNPIVVGESLFFTDPTVGIFSELGSTGWFTVVTAPTDFTDLDDESYRDVVISLVNEAGSEVEACYAELSREPATVTMTAFCQQENGYGTIWIQAIKVPKLRSDSDDAQLALARQMAVEECALAWYGEEEEDTNTESGANDDGDAIDVKGIVCMGLIQGEANVLEWDDSHIPNG